MSAGVTATPAMPMSAAKVEQMIIDAFLAASPGNQVPLSRDTGVLDIVDSLGLMMGLANLQTALKIVLEPKEIIGALQARSVADLASVLMTAMEARCTQPA
jgi:acyl carrier protein